MAGKSIVLLADDDKFDRFFFEKAIQDVSIPAQLVTVQDGEQLMDFLTNNNNQLPDVIFLDLNMPRKSGQECLMEIKRNQKLASIPIVIYSTALQPNTAEDLYRAGANYYLQKCEFSDLPEAIQRILMMIKNNPHRPSMEKFIVNALITKKH